MFSFSNLHLTANLTFHTPKYFTIKILFQVLTSIWNQSTCKPRCKNWPAARWRAIVSSKWSANASRLTPAKPNRSPQSSWWTSPKTENKRSNGVRTLHSRLHRWISNVYAFPALDLKNAKVYDSAPKEGKPNTTLTISDEDFILLATGKLNPQSAFMKGKLKVSGNVMMAQKLAPFLKTEAKL